jgi:hypothetical protein
LARGWDKKTRNLALQIVAGGDEKHGQPSQIDNKPRPGDGGFYAASSLPAGSERVNFEMKSEPPPHACRMNAANQFNGGISSSGAWFLASIWIRASRLSRSRLKIASTTQTPATQPPRMDQLIVHSSVQPQGVDQSRLQNIANRGGGIEA